MKTEPLVSIVLPTYNGTRYLEQAVRSCLDQSYRHWELILVDDASTDDTPALIARCERLDARVVSVRHEKNLRLPGALNTGFARARGAYMTWTSDDNLYEPDALERMVRYLEGSPATGLVYCDERLIGPDGEDLGPYAKPGPEVLADKNCVGACFLYRREVYEVVGEYDPEMFLVEDYDYWLRVARRFPIAHLKGVAPYRYRTHPGSLTSARRGEVALQTARARCRHALPATRHRQVLAEAYWQALWTYRKAKDLRSAWYCARKCLALAPARPRHLKAVLATGLRMLASGRRGGMPVANRVLSQPDFPAGGTAGPAVSRPQITCPRRASCPPR
jgi:glycosyltransferase involved in cell wall biosynthesis